MSMPFFGEIISQQGLSLDRSKQNLSANRHAANEDKWLQSFLGILNYLSKISPVTAKVCEPLCKLTSVKTD